MPTFTSHARRSSHVWVALAIASLLLGGVDVSTASAAPGSITGMFSDGWWPEAYQPSRPTNLIPGSMTAVTDTGTIVVQGTGAEDGQSWGVVVYGPDFGHEGLPTVGRNDNAILTGPGTQCGNLEGYADVLEVEYGPGTSIIRFAATVWTHCLATNPLPAWVRTDVRFHSTIGFHAVSIAPLEDPSPSWKPDIDVGDLRVDDAPISGSFTVTNSGTLPLRVGVDDPAHPAFTLEPGGCDGSAIAAGASCSIDVFFEPPTAGIKEWTIDLLTPDLDRTSQPLKIRGRGVTATTAQLTVLDSSDIEQQDWPGLTWFALGRTPSYFDGFAEVATTCGRGIETPLKPFFAHPHLVPVDGLPAGPCRATMHMYGTYETGFEPSDAIPVDFVVPSYSSVSARFEGFPWVRADTAVDMLTEVGQVNGATPAGGHLTVVDETTDTVLVDRAVTPETLSASTPIAGFSAGTHDLRVEYTGDGIVEPAHGTFTITADAAPPEGTIAIEEGEPYTPDPDVDLELAAVDAVSEVTQMRVSNNGTVSGGRLVDGIEVPAGSDLAWHLTPGNGPRKVFVQWRDTVGNWSVPKSDTITVDAVAPTVGTATTTVLAGGALSHDRTPLKVSVTAADASSGIAATRLQVSVDGGAWVDLGLGATRTVFAVTGHAYRYRGIATDRAGNQTSGATSSAQTIRMTQGSSSTVTRHGSWAVTSVAGTLGGTVVRSRTNGANASYATTARGLAVIAPVGPTSGKAKIYVDGVYRTTISLYRSTAAGSRVVYSVKWTSAGRHTVRLVVSSGRVDLDAFAAY